jgi:hypothetical protein
LVFIHVCHPLKWYEVGQPANEIAGLPCVLAERGLGQAVLGFLELEDLCALRRAAAKPA